MSESSSEIQGVTASVDREKYLSNLPEIDRRNVTSFCTAFKETLEEKSISGFLIAVGGTVHKREKRLIEQGKRPDVDLVMVLSGTPETNRQLDAQEKVYERYRTFTADLLAKTSDLVLESTDEPAPDVVRDVFGYPGAFTIAPKDGNGRVLEVLIASSLR